MAPSVPPVPPELVDLISQNSYVDFKFLLPSNLAVIASLPAISQQIYLASRLQDLKVQVHLEIGQLFGPFLLQL